MKNKKSILIFACTLLLSSCFIIKTENTNNFTAKELLYRAAYYGTANVVSSTTANYFVPNINTIKKDDPDITKKLFCFFGIILATQMTSLELLNNYGQDKTYIKKMGKKRIISNLASFAGVLLGSSCGSIGSVTCGAACGAGSDYILNKLFPPKNSPLDPTTLKKNTTAFQQFINSKQSNN